MKFYRNTKLFCVSNKILIELKYMSNKLKEIEKEILYYGEKLVNKKTKDPSFNIGDLSYLRYSDEYLNQNVETVESLSELKNNLVIKRQFELERKARMFYNQEWFKILMTSIFSILTTVIATWFIIKFIK